MNHIPLGEPQDQPQQLRHQRHEQQFTSHHNHNHGTLALGQTSSVGNLVSGARDSGSVDADQLHTPLTAPYQRSGQVALHVMNCADTT
jgi:hypothetical protein